jgi:hypothetical protein
MTDSESGSLVVGLLILVRHGVHGTDVLFFFLLSGVIGGPLFLIQPRPFLYTPPTVSPPFMGWVVSGAACARSVWFYLLGRPSSSFFNDEENL